MKCAKATKCSFSPPPESSRQEVRETSKALPLCGGTRQSVIKTRIDHEVFPQRIRCGPWIPKRITVRQRLCEVPYLTRDRQLADRMRDRERPGKLRSPYSGLVVLLLHHEPIHVEVKTAEVVTQQDGRALDEGAEIEFRRSAGIKPPQVLDGDRRPFRTRQNDRLYACENLSQSVA